jgi:hypothetical protein
MKKQKEKTIPKATRRDELEQEAKRPRRMRYTAENEGKPAYLRLHNRENRRGVNNKDKNTLVKTNRRYEV